MERDRNDDGVADDERDADLATTEPDDDPQGMRGQLDDSMDGLEEDDDPDEAARGIPQN